MVWYDTFEGAFWLTVLSLLTGCFGYALRMCLKSKCETFNLCWGLINLTRRVDLEVQEEMKAIELGRQISNGNLIIETKQSI